MAIVEFTISNQSNFIKGDLVLTTRETIATPGNGNTYIIPEGIGKMNSSAILLDARSGKANIYYSISSREKVLAGEGIFFPWDNGEVTGSIDTLVTYPITAIYQKNVSGTTTFEVIIE